MGRGGWNVSFTRPPGYSNVTQGKGPLLPGHGSGGLSHTLKQASRLPPGEPTRRQVRDPLLMGEVAPFPPSVFAQTRLHLFPLALTRCSGAPEPARQNSRHRACSPLSMQRIHGAAVQAGHQLTPARSKAHSTSGSVFQGHPS